MASKKQDTTPEAVAAGSEASAGQEAGVYILLTALRKGGKRYPAGAELELSAEEAQALPVGVLKLKVD